MKFGWQYRNWLKIQELAVAPFPITIPWTSGENTDIRNCSWSSLFQQTVYQQLNKMDTVADCLVRKVITMKTDSWVVHLHFGPLYKLPLLKRPWTLRNVCRTTNVYQSSIAHLGNMGVMRIRQGPKSEHQSSLLGLAFWYLYWNWYYSWIQGRQCYLMRITNQW